MPSLRRAVGAIVGSDFSDPTNERIIYLSAAGLALLGALLLAGTIVWWRRGRQEHPVLGPLEVMGEKRWWKSPDGDRRRQLDDVRLGGNGTASEPVVDREQVDLEALVRNVPQDFDDLRDPVEASGSAAAVLAVAVGDAAGDGDEDEAELAVGAEADATMMSTERPLDDLAAFDDLDAESVPVSAVVDHESVEVIEAVASSPIDPLL